MGGDLAFCEVVLPYQIAAMGRLPMYSSFGDAVLQNPGVVNDE
jgi:hypothetical protein